MASEPQLLFDLFDSYWFAHQIFNKSQTPPPKSPKNKEPTAETSKNLEFSSAPTTNSRSTAETSKKLEFSSFPTTNSRSAAETSKNLEFSSLPTINSRYHSDQLFINSPNSVMNLQTPKEVKEVAGVPAVKNKNDLNIKKMKSKSKSLSELEFEELKGFMDLGFLFTEKDKDTSLVWIIPGLERLGKEEVHKSVGVSRPYLSEAWGGDMKEGRSRVIRIPVLGNEANVKNELRFWAHSVASVVR